MTPWYAFNQSYFRYVRIEHTHFDARKYCAEQNGGLASISLLRKNTHSCIKNFLYMKREVSITLSYEKLPMKNNKFQLLDELVIFTSAIQFKFS